MATSRAAKIFRCRENSREDAGGGRCFGAGGLPAKMAGKMDAAASAKTLLPLALTALQFAVTAGRVGRPVCASCSRIVSASNRAIASCRRCKPADESRCPAAHPLGKPVGTRLLPAPEHVNLRRHLWACTGRGAISIQQCNPAAQPSECPHPFSGQAFAPYCPPHPFMQYLHLGDWQ